MNLQKFMNEYKAKLPGNVLMSPTNKAKRLWLP